ncbi:MAG: hypothetical protein AAF567_08655 [Actinomycetota bacterium]
MPCRLSAATSDPISFGIPRSDLLAPSVGTVNIAVLFADFPDVPTARSVEDVWSIFDGTTARFYRDNSYGRLELNYTPHLAWLDMSQPSAYYGEALRDGELHRQFIQEAVTLADPVVDFGPFDLVLVVSNPLASAIPYGPVFVSDDPSYGIAADGRIFTTSVTSGYDLNHWGAIWLAHEMGHTMAMPDLYAFEGADNLRFTGQFSIMGDIAGASPELFAFERWRLGWLDHAQIACHQSGSAQFTLSPIETPGGLKAAVVPLDSNRVLVVESRRALGFDSGMPVEGAVVYLVDGSVPSGFGPLVVAPGADAGPLKSQAPLTAGESYRHASVTVTVVAAGPHGDTVEVSVDP